jgi:integrase
MKFTVLWGVIWGVYYREVVLGKLTQLKVKHAKPGKHEDGRGLRLVVSSSGAGNWLLRIQHQGRRREIGLGSASTLGLADARAKAESMRTAIRAGLDPVAERRRAKSEIPSFRDVALMVHKENLPSWKNPKHGNQWISTLEKYAFPTLGDARVDMITGPMVREALVGIWLTIPETARRVRQRIGMVLDYAHSRGWREQEAPMRSVSKGLPKQQKVQKHFAAMPWREVPSFLAEMADCIKATDVVMSAIEFTILTAARSGEVRGATWGEIDFDAAVWTVPGERMKAGVEHRVPLSNRAIEILQKYRPDNEDGLIFVGRKNGQPLSDMSLSTPLRRANMNITVHGFRSSFRDWCGEATNTPREVAERCLAHAVSDKTEAAYARSDYFEKRREVMNLWAAFCKEGKFAAKVSSVIEVTS